MAVWLVVVALVAVAGSGALAWAAQRSADREAHRAVQAVLRQALDLIQMRPEAPEPIIVPPMDLRPYLQELARMGQGMARELAQGISLVVQGPAPRETAQEPAPGETEEKEEPVEFPPWESDDTWGITDRASELPGDEWSASFFPDMAYRGKGGAEEPFGAGGIHLPDNEGL